MIAVSDTKKQRTVVLTFCKLNWFEKLGSNKSLSLFSKANNSTLFIGTGHVYWIKCVIESTWHSSTSDISLNYITHFLWINVQDLCSIIKFRSNLFVYFLIMYNTYIFMPYTLVTIWYLRSNNDLKIYQKQLTVVN